MDCLIFLWRFCSLVGLAAWLSASPQAYAYQIAPLDIMQADTVGAGVPAPMRVVEGLGANVGVEQVAQLPDARFEAFSPTRNYAFSYEKPVWLHLRVQSHSASQGQWQLEFPAILIDRYDVFQRDASGQWKASTAGDAVPYEQWALPSMRPRFPLLLPQAGLHDVFIRLEFRLPSNLQPVIVSRELGVERDFELMMWSGLLAGLLLTIAVTCLHMSYAYRDSVYFWYASYQLACMFTMLVYTGLAQRLLWPASTSFANDAISVFVISVLLCNMLFCRALFGGLQGRRYHLLTACFVVLGLVYIALRLLIDDYSKISLLYNGLVVSIYLFIVYSAASALRRGFVFGGYWLLIYLPYLLLSGLAIVKSIGLLPLAWLPTHTPLVALMIESVAMLLFINVYSSTRHAQAVREQAAAQHDALTGFLNAEHFHRFASRAWDKAQQPGHYATLIYVSVESKLLPEQTMVEQEAMLLRSVRMVRTAMREFDVVGRMGRNLLGICVVDRPSNEALAARLSRLVALGLMHDDPKQAVQFTIAVADHSRFFDTYPHIEPALLQLLALPTSSGRKPIRYYSPTELPVQDASAGIPLAGT